MPNRENRIPVGTTVSNQAGLLTKPPVATPVPNAVVCIRRAIAQPLMSLTTVTQPAVNTETKAVF